MFMVLDQYHIKDSLGYFIMDDTTANDCVVVSILHQLFEKDGLSYNSEQQQLRCNDYIIYLLVQAFLFRPLPEYIILASRRRDEKGLTTAKLQRWCKMGPLRKLHNIVIYIKASPQQTQVFLTISGKRMVR